MAAKYKIVMVRHGESEWNKENKFCGWFDAKLSEKGVGEAKKAGEALKEAGFKFDLAFTSLLQRAQITLENITEIIGQNDLETMKTWRLNERHYGSLTGLNKADTAKKYGDEQVHIWRRSFNVPPPKMENDHPYYNSIHGDARYKSVPEADIPYHESLELTIQRTLPFWENNIVPAVKSGKSCIIAAHGNSLRGIVKHLEGMTNDEIMLLNLPTGIPFVYELDENFKPVKTMQFLGDEETVKKAMEAVANQGKAKK